LHFVLVKSPQFLVHSVFKVFEGLTLNAHVLCFKHHYHWIIKECYVIFRWDIPIVLYRIIKYIGKIHSNATYKLCLTIFYPYILWVLRILATKSLQACCFLVIIRILCLSFWIKCRKECFQKSFWYKHDVSVILLSNFWESWWWSHSWASYKLTVIIDTNFYFQFVARYQLFTAPTCFGHRKWLSLGSYKLHICIQIIFQIFFCLWLDSPRGPWPSQWGSIQVGTPHSVVLPWMGDLPDNTQRSRETAIHYPGRIRTHNPEKRAAVDPHLRPCSHWDRHVS